MSYTLSDFVVSGEVLKNYKNLVDLIVASETISDKDQKQYWIDAIEDMSDDQMDSLLSILNEEQEGFQKISEEFDNDLKKEKAEEAEIERIRKKREREEKERILEEKEDEIEADLLAELDDL